MDMEGDVVRRRVLAGSKSERDAVLLKTDQDEFIMRPRNTPILYPSSDMQALVGKRIRVSGFVHAGSVFYDSLEVLRDE